MKNIIILCIWVLAIIGEVKCVVKAVKCNWEPIGKAEVIYTGAALCGLGSIVGYINLEDE